LRQCHLGTDLRYHSLFFLQIKTHTSSGFWTALTRNPTFTTATLSQENNIPARGHTIYGGFGDQESGVRNQRSPTYDYAPFY
jgi:hypothetical protein